MKRVVFSFALLLALPSAAALAADKPADAICPTAVPALTAMNAADQSDLPKLQTAVEAVVRAYRECASTALSSNAIEPNEHYDQVRQAQHEIIVGRIAAKLGKTDVAKAAYLDARNVADGVVQWRTGGLGYATSNQYGTATTRDTGSHLASRFAAPATDVRDAAIAELKALGVDSPASAASPSPSSTP